MDATTILFSTLVAGVIYYVFTKLFGKKNSVPTASTSSIPILGRFVTVDEYNKDPVSFINNSQKKYGDVFTLDLIAMKMTMIVGSQYHKWYFTQPENSLSFDVAIDKLFFDKQFGKNSRDPAFEAISKNIMIKGLTTPEMLNHFSTVIHNTIDEYFQNWANRGTIDDLTLEISKLVLSMDVRALLGKVDPKIEEELIMGIRTTEQLVFDPLVALFPNVPSKPQRIFRSTRDRVFQIIQQSVSDAINNKDQETATAYVNSVVQLTEGVELRHDSIRNHLFGILGAAHTNTAAILCWTILHLLKDSELRERVMKDLPEDISEAKSSPILEYCMHETMRLYAILFEPRVTMNDVTIANVVIPKGTFVTIAPTNVQHDPALFPNPEKYDPYRWENRDKIRDDASNYVLLHFGYGKHRCLGEKFATHTTKLAIYKLLKDFKMEICSDMPTPNYAKASGAPFPLQTVKARVNKL